MIRDSETSLNVLLKNEFIQIQKEKTFRCTEQDYVIKANNPSMIIRTIETSYLHSCTQNVILFCVFSHSTKQVKHDLAIFKAYTFVLLLEFIELQLKTNLITNNLQSCELLNIVSHSFNYAMKLYVILHLNGLHIFKQKRQNDTSFSLNKTFISTFTRISHIYYRF